MGAGVRGRLAARRVAEDGVDHDPTPVVEITHDLVAEHERH